MKPLNIYSVFMFLVIGIMYKCTQNERLMVAETAVTNPFSSSIVFYIIVGQNQTLPVDLRGNFWKPQLLDFPKLNVTIHYVSDGPLTINGKECIILPENSTSIIDPKLCIRSRETWFHFQKYHPDAQWFIRGTHHTFYNISNLLRMLNNLENSYGDPKTHLIASYGIFEYWNVLYPNGGPGWIFSGHLVGKICRNIELFDVYCDPVLGADDTALGSVLDNLRINLIQFHSSQFIVALPRLNGDITSFDWNVPNCPESYRIKKSPKLAPSLFSTAVAIHPNTIQMEEVIPYLNAIPPDVGMAFDSIQGGFFCRMNQTHEWYAE